MRSDSAYEQLRRQVERDLQNEKERRARFLFRLNMAIYVLFLVIAWVRLFPIFEGFWQQEVVPSLVMLTIAGFVQVVIHWAAYRMATSPGERALRERLLGRAVEATMGGDQTGADKPKRYSHLSAEGELLDEADGFEDDESLARVKRR
jgi:hypothetical protein